MLSIKLNCSSSGGGSELEIALNQRTSNMNDFFVRDETWKQIRHIIQLHTIECHSAVCTVYCVVYISKTNEVVCTAYSLSYRRLPFKNEEKRLSNRELHTKRARAGERAVVRRKMKNKTIDFVQCEMLAQ